MAATYENWFLDYDVLRTTTVYITEHVNIFLIGLFKYFENHG
jgi:hypothetical protein